MGYRIHSLFVVLVCLVTGWGSLLGQTGLIAPVDGWTAYVSHKSTVEITKRGDWVYAITEGGLFGYHLPSDSIASFSTVEGLSGIDPTTILSDPLSGLLFLGFQDGTINYLDADHNIYYISDIERSEIYTTKAVNRFESRDGDLYIATDFGIVVYDIARKETRYSVTKISDNPSGSPVMDISIANGRLWAAMGDRGLWSVDLSESNPTLPSIWRREDSFNDLPQGSVSFVCHTGDIVYCLMGDTIFKREASQNWIHSAFAYRKWTYLVTTDDVVAACVDNFAGVIWPDGNYIELDNEGSIRCVYPSNPEVFVGDGTVGLQRWKPVEGFSGIAPDGPKNNFVTDIAAGDGDVYIAPRGVRPPSARRFDKSGIPYFNLHNGGWKVNDLRSGDLFVDSVYQDFVCAYYDKATRKCYVGSYGEGIVELEKGEVIRTYTSQNSGLNSGSSNNLVTGLVVDESGNLWVTQRIANIPLNVKTPEGVWYTYTPQSSLTPLGIIVDDYNNKWIINSGQGLVVFNDNFTLDNRSDDQVRTINSSFGNGGLPNNSVLSIAQDLDQQIWIGTTEGVTIIYDPSVIWTNDFQDAACPIIDGFCLLRDQRVNDIAVDGANRKWLATENGAYLVNVDGTELLEHWTTENSPLLDDNILAVEVDHSTGEVFFGTNKGTISYIGRAIFGRETAEELYAFPNPVTDDFEGDVMIKGMRAFSKVKITTTDGRLVRELDSFGGEVPWDRRDTYGNKVLPGIYLIMVADQDGEGAGIAKLAIVNLRN